MHLSSVLYLLVSEFIIHIIPCKTYHFIPQSNNFNTTVKNIKPSSFACKPSFMDFFFKKKKLKNSQNCHHLVPNNDLHIVGMGIYIMSKTLSEFDIQFTSKFHSTWAKCCPEYVKYYDHCHT